VTVDSMPWDKVYMWHIVYTHCAIYTHYATIAMFGEAMILMV